MPTEATNQATEVNEKVTFDERQQARLDELIKEAQGRAASGVRAELATTKSQLSELNAQLQTLQSELAKAKSGSGSQGSGDESNSLLEEARRISAEAKAEAERLREMAKAKEKEADDAKSETLNVRKRVAIQEAASKQKFVDLGIVSKVTSDLIKYDETRGRFIVMNESGTERLNSAYEPMSLDEFYAEYANKNPYLVHGDTKTGVGSSESQRAGLSKNGKFTVEQIFGPKSDGALANALKKSDPLEYGRLKVIAREHKMIA